MSIKIITSSLSQRCVIELEPQLYLKNIISLKTHFITQTPILSDSKSYSLFIASKVFPYLQSRYPSCSLLLLNCEGA